MPVTAPTLLVAVIAVTVFVAIVRIALWSPSGQSADDRAMLTVVAGRDARLALLSVLGRVSVWSVATVAAACLLVAAARRHGRAALGALVVLCGANVTTQALKHTVLDRPDFGLGVHNSLPSGHVTVVAASVGALLLVVPPAVRPAVAGIGTFAIGMTGLSTIVAGWHRPADVAAALAVVVAWTCVGVLVHGGRRGRARSAFLTSVSGGVASLVAIVLVGVRPVDGLAGFVEASLVLGAVALTSVLAIWAMAWLGPIDDQP